MIPDGQFCPQQWVKEYDGWLMAASGDRRNKAAVYHVCMDKGLTLGGTISNAPHLEVVKVRTGDCTTNNCRTLENQKNVPCIVCST